VCAAITDGRDQKDHQGTKKGAHHSPDDGAEESDHPDISAEDPFCEPYDIQEAPQQNEQPGDQSVNKYFIDGFAPSLVGFHLREIRRRP